MDVKPGDLYIGVIEFISVLLPGSAAMALVVAKTDWEAVPVSIMGILRASGGAPAWLAFFFAAYTIGHVIYRLSAMLDTIYMQTMRWLRRGKDQTYAAAARLRKAAHPEVDETCLTTLKWARVYVRLRNPGARAEIDGLEASSKFFRSLATLLFVLAVYAPCDSALPLGARLWVCALALASAFGCFLCYANLRWKFTETAFTYVIAITKWNGGQGKDGQ